MILRNYFWNKKSSLLIVNFSKGSLLLKLNSSTTSDWFESSTNSIWRQENGFLITKRFHWLFRKSFFYIKKHVSSILECKKGLENGKKENIRLPLFFKNQLEKKQRETQKKVGFQGLLKCYWNERTSLLSVNLGKDITH